MEVVLRYVELFSALQDPTQAGVDEGLFHFSSRGYIRACFIPCFSALYLFLMFCDIPSLAWCFMYDQSFLSRCIVRSMNEKMGKRRGDNGLYEEQIMYLLSQL